MNKFKMAKQDNTIFWMIGIVIVLLVVTQFGLFTLFASLPFNFEKEISYQGEDAIVKSTRDFGTTVDTRIWEACDGTRETETHINNVLDDKFSIYLKNYATTSKSGCGYGRLFGETRTYILTKNLNITKDNLEKLEITFKQSSSLACPDPMTSAGGGNSIISLIGDSSKNLFVSTSTINKIRPSTSKDGKIIVTRSGDDFILDLLGDKNLIELPNGILELKIYSNIIDQCRGGGRAMESIEILSLSIDKVSPEQPEIYYRFQDNTCNQIELLSSEITNDDYSTLQDCEENIIIVDEEECNIDDDCPEGFECLNDLCQLKEDFEIICPEGFDYNLESDKCEKYPDTGIICLEGTYNTETGKCEIHPTTTIIAEEWYTQTSLTIGDFEVKLWMLMFIGGLLFLLIIIGGKRR